MGAVVIFTSNVVRVADFYANVLGATDRIDESSHVRLFSDTEEVVVHAMGRAPTAAATDVPEDRSDVAIKPVFEVAVLDDALEAVRAWGGFITDRRFEVDGLVRHDVCDPDGNVIQLRADVS